MIRCDRATYLSLLFKFILSAGLSNISRIRKYSSHLCIIPLLDLLYCYILF